MNQPVFFDMPAWTRNDAVAAALLIAAALAANASIALFGHVPLDADSLLFFYPLVALHGDPHLGLWDPYQFCGFPRDANPQAQLLYWPAWVAMILPAPAAFSALIVFHFALGGLLMHALLRGLRLSPTAAGLGAFAFICSTYWRCKITNLGILEGAAWAPGVLFFCLLAIQRRSFACAIAASLFLAMTMLAGVPHTVVYLLLLTLILHLAFIHFRPKPSLAPLGLWLAMAASATALCAGMLVPAILNLPETVRSSLSLDQALAGSLPPNDIWKAFIGGLTQPGISRHDPWEGTCYFTITALLFALFGCRVMPRRLKWGLLTAFAVSVVFTLGQDGALYPLLYQWLPGWSSLNLPNRSLFMAALSLPVFIGFGAERALAKDHSKRHAPISLLFGLLALIGWVVGASLNPSLLTTTVHSALTAPFHPPAYSDGVWAAFNACLWGGLTLLLWGAYAIGWLKTRLFAALLFALIAAQAAQYNQRLFLQTAPPETLREPRTARVIEDALDQAPFARVTGFDPTLDSGSDVRMSDTLPLFMPRLAEALGLHDIQGYDPLAPRRYAELMRQWAGHLPIVNQERHVRLQSLPPRMLELTGVQAVAGRPDGVVLYQGRETLIEPGSLAAALVPAQPVNAVLLRWMTLASASLPQGARIGTVRILSGSQAVEAFPIRMGIDVADQFVEFESRAANHSSAAEYRWFPIPSKQGYERARQYEARYPVLSQNAVDAVSIELSTANIGLALYGIAVETGNAGALTKLDAAAETPVWMTETPHPPVYISRTSIAYSRLSEMIERINQWPEGEALPVFFYEDDGPAPERAPIEGRLEGDARVDYTRIYSDRFTVSVDSQFDAILAVAETWSPHWSASIEGKPVPVLRANHSMMAVQLPAGSHSVEFEYFPKPYYFGCAAGLTMLTFALVVLALYPASWLLPDQSRPKGEPHDESAA